MSQLSLGNGSYSKDVCEKCGIGLDRGCVLVNKPEHCNPKPTYSYMNIGQSMHLECYLGHVIDEYLKKISK